MNQTRADTRVALLQALGLHVALFAVMFAGLQWTRSNVAEAAHGEVIEADLVDVSDLSAAMQRALQRDPQPLPQPIAEPEPEPLPEPVVEPVAEIPPEPTFETELELNEPIPVPRDPSRPRLRLTPTATDAEFSTVFEQAGGRGEEPGGEGWTWKDLLSSIDDTEGAEPELVHAPLEEALAAEIGAMGIDPSALLPRGRLHEIAVILHAQDAAITGCPACRRPSRSESRGRADRIWRMRPAPPCGWRLPACRPRGART